MQCSCGTISAARDTERIEPHAGYVLSHSQPICPPLSSRRLEVAPSPPIRPSLSPTSLSGALRQQISALDSAFRRQGPPIVHGRFAFACRQHLDGCTTRAATRFLLHAGYVRRLSRRSIWQRCVRETRPAPVEKSSVRPGGGDPLLWCNHSTPCVQQHSTHQCIKSEGLNKREEKMEGKT
jgi:hypothetical protein